MWVDDTDLTQLSQLLRVGPRELIEAIGGPWHASTPVEEDEVAHHGAALFVGRAGPSVGIMLGSGVLLVGSVEGSWTDAGELHWRLRGDAVSIAVPGRDAEVDDFLAAMGSAVEEAFARQQPSLVTCRYCARLLVPARARDDRMCLECAAAIFGLEPTHRLP